MAKAKRERRTSIRTMAADAAALEALEALERAERSNAEPPSETPEPEPAASTTAEGERE
jgi:hypothetical protein